MVGLVTRMREAYVNITYGGYESIPAEEYYAEFLQERDRKPLKEFVAKFAAGLEDGERWTMGIKPTILAVGSSLHSKVHHDYRDIDLRVYPEQAMQRTRQIAEIKEALASKGYKYTFEEAVAYTEDTIMVPLESRMVVDIIFGCEEMVPSADDAIEKELKSQALGCPFSILYGKWLF